MREDSRTDICRFLGMDQKRNGTELTRSNRMENVIESLRTWCSFSVKADTPYSVDPMLWNEEISKGKGKLSIHFCGDDNTAELVLRTISSVNRLNIYGGVADMCDEAACGISGCSECARKLVAKLRALISKPSRSSSTDQLVLQCWYHEDRGEDTVFHDPRRCETE